MKKRGLLLLLPVLLAAIGWCVNWKLDHPAPTAADAAFARLIRGADEVEIATFSQKSQVSLRGTELAVLIDGLHFKNEAGLSGSMGYDDLYTFTWKKKGVILSAFDIDFAQSFQDHNPTFSQTDSAKHSFCYQLNSRSVSRLVTQISGFHLNLFG